MTDEGDGGSTLNSAVLPWTVSSPIFGALLGAPPGGVFVAFNTRCIRSRVPLLAYTVHAASLLVGGRNSVGIWERILRTLLHRCSFPCMALFNGAYTPEQLLPPWTFPAHSVGPSLAATPWRGARGWLHQVSSFLYGQRTFPLPSCLLAAYSRVGSWQPATVSPPQVYPDDLYLWRCRINGASHIAEIEAMVSH